MAGARSHTEIIAWQLAHDLKLRVYELIEHGPITRHGQLRDQLQRSAANAPRAIAEGFGRYLPDDFSRYLRYANGELKETFDGLQDGYDRRCFTREQVEPLQRLSKRASKAATRLIGYLKNADAPGEPRRRRRAQPKEPSEPKEPLEPLEPPEPKEPPAPPEPKEPPEPSV